MDIRLRQEQLESQTLSPYACLSESSRGRLLAEDQCGIRTVFQRDRDRIIHSKSFRRLKYKTQVFIIPEGDHFRTRLTHTLEVAQIARTAARALRLNEDLAEAIALGHDLGHTPFGHAGEDALDQVHPGGFKHNEQSLRVVDSLEGGNGLNLSYEVRDGILNHTGDTVPATLEGQVVRYCDRIAYINHDIDDAIRGGVLHESQLPFACLGVLGGTHRERINNMVLDLVEASRGPAVRLSPVVQEATDQLRGFMFEHVYLGTKARKEVVKAKRMVGFLYHYLTENPEALPGGCFNGAQDDIGRAVCDYIAGMTDRYAVSRFMELFVPGSFDARE